MTCWQHLSGFLKSYWGDLIMMKSINKALLSFTTVFFYIYICLLQITKFVDFSAWPCLLQDLLCIWFEIVLNFFDWFRVIRMKSRSDHKFVHNLWTIPPPYPDTTADLAPTIIYFHWDAWFVSSVPSSHWVCSVNFMRARNTFFSEYF